MNNYLEKFDILEKIGEGTYGVVYKAKDTTNNSVVAVKKIRLEHCEEGIPQTTLREISFLRDLDHKNVVRLLDIRCEGKKIFLIFEYAEHDLKKVMQQRQLTRAESWNILPQILEGILYCHTNRVIHRDLKPQNILLDESGVVKLADFGLARSFTVPLPSLTHEVVTLWYRSPEILLGQKVYSPAIDLWSIGCIYAEMLLGKPLLAGDSEIDQLFKIFQLLGTPSEANWPGVTSLPDYKPSFPRFKPRGLASVLPDLSANETGILGRMLTLDPIARANAFELLRFVFLSGSHCRL